ncbi:MAG: exo-alpha-sialidase [Paludibacter sp.]|nr:exo-alpha-sialidase [Paludibacter sp.]
MKRIIQYLSMFISLFVIYSFQSYKNDDSQLVFVRGEGVEVCIFQNGSRIFQHENARISEIPQVLFGKDYLIVTGKVAQLEFSVAEDAQITLLLPFSEKGYKGMTLTEMNCYFLEKPAVEMRVYKKKMRAGKVWKFNPQGMPFTLLAPVILLNSDKALLEVMGGMIDIDTLKQGKNLFLKDKKTIVTDLLPDYLQQFCFAKPLPNMPVADSVRCYKACEFYMATTGTINDSKWQKQDFLATETGSMQLYRYAYNTPGKWIELPQIGNASSILIGEDIRIYQPPALLGTPICISTNQDKHYITDPTVVILPGGEYLAACKSRFDGENSVVRILKSKDKGITWSYVTELSAVGFFNFFVLNKSVYLMGTKGGFNQIVILRSDDGGQTWTSPTDSRNGLLSEAKSYHSASTATVFHNGRVWRAMEDNIPLGKRFFRALVMSAPIASDLLEAANWTFSEALPYERVWLGDSVAFNGWYEGNVVVSPDGEIVNMLRVETYKYNENAAIIHYSKDGKKASFDPRTDIVPFPGGEKKFTVYFDSVSHKYWTLSNMIFKEDYGMEHGGLIRNRLVLSYSPDLYHWDVKDILISHPDAHFHAYQYVDWRIDGDDIIAVARTASDSPRGLSPRQHDANYLTFHRFTDFRKRIYTSK